MSPLWLGLAYYCEPKKYTKNNKVFSQGYSLFQLIAKMILSNTEWKKLVDILISICILYFIDISVRHVVLTFTDSPDTTIYRN